MFMYILREFDRFVVGRWFNDFHPLKNNHLLFKSLYSDGLIY